MQGFGRRRAARVLWLLNRLRAMGAPEIAFRVRRALVNRLEGIGFGLARPGSPQGRSGAPWCAAPPTNVDVAAHRDAADRILAGRFDVFALRGAELGFPPRWTRDPRTGVEAPMAFGKAINYRDEKLVGDIKYLWEPSRHLELVTLAQAWHVTGEVRYAEACRIYLESWLDACPYPRGVHWTSSLELAIRLVNWHVAWHLLGADESPLFAGADGAAFRARWQRSVFEHAHFIAGYLSMHSSANNHLLGEYMGLLVAGVTWPLWPESERWRVLGAQGFEAQALLQNAPDGVNLEQAIYYQHEVIDMMILCGLIGRANGVEFSAAYWERLEKLLGFVAAVMDRAGHVPMIGDADDAVMVRLAPGEHANVYRSQLAAGAVLFDRSDFAAKSGALDATTRWLLGDVQAEFDKQRAAGEARGAAVPREFPHGGYYILGDDFDGPREIRIVADAAPLGYLSLAAHGHADALAFTLSVAGCEMLIDPGTYAYHTHRQWRDYFKGTSAHNTVRIDGRDQSESGGNFLWTHQADARCEHFESTPAEDRFVGVHDGYRRLPDPVMHRREIVLDKAARRIAVRDAVECASSHVFEVHWHFGEDCEVEVVDGAVHARNGDVRICLTMDHPDFRPELVRGRDDPPLGWISRRFDAKLASTTVCWSARVTGSVQWTTVVDIEYRSDTPANR